MDLTQRERSQIICQGARRAPKRKKEPQKKQKKERSKKDKTKRRGELCSPPPMEEKRKV
jgi:hypothetical protein